MFSVENRLQKQAFGLPCLTQNQIWSKLMFGFLILFLFRYLIAKDSPENVKEVTFTESDASVWKKQVSCEKQS
jgi:hypothetical protein